METPNDFVVIEEESCTQKALLDRLGVLVDLFSKALDAVNQSNVLLKDELRSALSVTLSNLRPDTETSTEVLVKALDNTVTSTDDIRANYTRNLCSRLVAVNEQNEILSAELSSLKQSILTKDTELEEQLQIASSSVKKINEILRPQKFEESDNRIRSLDELNGALNDITDHVAQLHLTVQQLQDIKASTSTHAEQLVQTNRTPEDKVTPAAHVESSSQTDDCPYFTPGQHVPGEVAERSGPFEFHTNSETASPAPPQSETQPTFSAQQEEPWCPCCNQAFDTRSELELHLQSCLQ